MEALSAWMFYAKGRFEGDVTGRVFFGGSVCSRRCFDGVVIDYLVPDNTPFCCRAGSVGDVVGGDVVDVDVVSTKGVSGMTGDVFGGISTGDFSTNAFRCSLFRRTRFLREKVYVANVFLSEALSAGKYATEALSV